MSKAPAPPSQAPAPPNMGKCPPIMGKWQRNRRRSGHVPMNIAGEWVTRGAGSV